MERHASEFIGELFIIYLHPSLLDFFVSFFIFIPFPSFSIKQWMNLNLNRSDCTYSKTDSFTPLRKQRLSRGWFLRNRNYSSDSLGRLLYRLFLPRSDQKCTKHVQSVSHGFHCTGRSVTATDLIFTTLELPGKSLQWTPTPTFMEIKLFRCGRISTLTI